MRYAHRPHNCIMIKCVAETAVRFVLHIVHARNLYWHIDCLIDACCASRSKKSCSCMRRHQPRGVRPSTIGSRPLFHFHSFFARMTRIVNMARFTSLKSTAPLITASYDHAGRDRVAGARVSEEGHAAGQCLGTGHAAHYGNLKGNEHRPWWESSPNFLSRLIKDQRNGERFGYNEWKAGWLDPFLRGGRVQAEQEPHGHSSRASHRRRGGNCLRTDSIFLPVFGILIPRKTGRR